MTKAEELLPCPMCGSPAEMDTMQGFMPLTGNVVSNRIAIYCTQCPCDVGLCYADVEELHAQMVIDLWNSRALAEPAAQVPELTFPDRMVTPNKDAKFDDEKSWIERLGMQYGSRQMASLRGDAQAVNTADFWLQQIAKEHWHEILAALRSRPAEDLRDAEKGEKDAPRKS